MDNRLGKQNPAARWRNLLWITGALLAVMPGALFIKYYGPALLASTTPRATMYALFPLFGAYAVFLTWLQTLIGMNIMAFRRLYPRIDTWHRWEGTVALATAVVHPVVLILSVGLTTYLQFKFVPPDKLPFVLLGDLALTCLTITVISAWLMHQPWFRRHWHTLHYLNYGVFSVAWLHGWYLGSASRFAVMKAVWIFYGLIFVISVSSRVTRAIDRRRALAARQTTPAPSSAAPVGTKIALIDEVVEGKPFCATVGGAKLALFKFEGAFYAVDNICTHKGGPLCEGAVSEGTVVCPWHESEFDIKTGKVRRGPAVIDVKTYPLEIVGQEIRLKKGVEVKPPSAKPVAAIPALSETWDLNRPFSYKPFLDDVINGLNFRFKLYGSVNQVMIGHSADEIDIHLGSIHLTRQDVAQFEKLMVTLADKWKTEVSYCLYHTSQFPDDLILNVRGPEAPDNTAVDIKF